MRNFAKIFTAIVEAFAAYSCVADATEDLGVQVGNGEGKTTITLSLEESRTQLGEKTGDVYPLYWSAGDQIAVNGTASTALGEEWDGKSSASFTVEGVTLPYSIVYPAPTEAPLEEWGKETVEVTDPETGEPVLDPETGEPTTEEVDVLNAVLYPVTFPASQEYVANGIDGASAPMYGYSTKEGEVPTLKHLVGLLQFNVKGEGKVLKNIVVKSERGAIAGTFYVNCEKNLLVVKEGSTSKQVSMSFGDGLALGAEATTFYVTVPAGSYGTFVATLYTETEKMTVKFNSDVLPIAAGYVREFAPFTFVHNDNDTADEFIIDSEDKLIEFASIAKAFYPRTVARVTKSLDMSEKSWTPIEGFGNFVFDGGSEQGCTIKGLKAPLFGTTSGKIQNVTLEGVNLTSNGQLIMGAIANTLTSGGQAAKASLTNCKAIGTLTISNPEWTPTSDQDKDAEIVNYGGLVGRSLGADLVNCTNQVAVTVSKMTATSNSTMVVYSSIGGVVGYVNVATLYNAEEATTNITNCDNDAAISYHCTSSAESKALIGRPHLGGVMGCGENGANLEDCENTANGKISLNSHFYGEDGASQGVPVGGVVGYNLYGYLTRCTNNATVEADGIYKSLIIGGVAGYTNQCYIDGVTNNGAVEVKSTARIRGILAGGVAGTFYGDGNKYDHYFKNCTNNATLKVLASAEENWTVSTASEASYYYRIGGITGFGRTQTTGGCTNTENGDITISGNVKIATHSKWSEEAINIAGCVAFKTSGTPTGKWENYGDITVDATFSFDDDAAADIHPIAVAGVFGSHSGINAECNNYGNITYNGKYEGATSYLHIAGVYAGGNSANEYWEKAPRQAKNTGTITIGANTKHTTNVYVAGIQAYSTCTNDPTKFENTGTITFKEGASIGGDLHVGGIHGYYAGDEITIVVNSGALNFEKGTNIDKRLFLGGINGYFNGSELTATDIANSGDLTFNGNIPNGHLYVGGVNGYTAKNSIKDSNLESVTNSGIITFGQNATIGQTLYVGGISGYFGGSGTLTYVTNSGSVTLHKDVTISNRLYLGGIFGYYGAGNISNVTNSGNLTVGCDLESGKICVAGIGPYYSTKKTVTDVTNVGNIELTGTYKKSVNVSGIFAEMANTNSNTDASDYVRVVNGALGTDSKPVDDKGKITISGTCDYDTGNSGTGYNALCIAGLVASNHYQYRPGSMDSCHNYGDMEISGTIKGRVYMAGISVACPYGGKTITNSSNWGDITISFTQPNTDNGSIYHGGFAYTIDKAITFTNFHNKGNVTITDKAKLSEVVYLNGFAYSLSSATFDGCSNSGNIIHNGSQEANTVYIGGFSGYRQRGAIIKNGFTNSGDMIFSGTYKGGGAVYLGGIGTIYQSTQVFESGAIKNTGKIAFTGQATNASGKVYVGGLYAYVPASVTTLVANAATNVSFENEGLIEVTGSVTTPANAMIGGIIGKAESPITGATANCNVKSMDFPNAGMIMGSVRSDTVKAINCKVGGNMILSTETITEEDANGGDAVEVVKDVLTPLTIDNWFNYIYGDPVDEAVAKDVDGCSLL